MNITYKCPECCAPINWDSTRGIFKCDFCDGEYTAEEIRAVNGDALTDENSKNVQHAVEVSEDEKKFVTTDDGTEGSDLVKYKCSHCNAELITERATAATTCVYCGHPVVIAEQLIGNFSPEYVIPFSKKKEEALNAFTSFSKKILTPKDFKDMVTFDKIQGIYIPFWLFNGHCDMDGKFESLDLINEVTTSDKKVERTWKKFINNIKGIATFENVPSDGSSKTDDEAMQSIEPYDYSALTPFNAAYLSGYLAERYDEDSESQKVKFEKRIVDSSHDKLIDTCKHDRVITKNFTHKITYDKVSYALLPVWLLYCSYKGKRYLFAMNGQTGKFIGNLPISLGKAAAIWSGIFAALGALIWFIL